MFSGPHGPVGGNLAVYLDRFIPRLTRTFTPAAYPHRNLISHTTRMPLSRDTHTHTHHMRAHTHACGVIKHNKVGVRCYTHINAANLVRSLSSSIPGFGCWSFITVRGKVLHAAAGVYLLFTHAERGRRVLKADSINGRAMSRSRGDARKRAHVKFVVGRARARSGGGGRGVACV